MCTFRSQFTFWRGYSGCFAPLSAPDNFQNPEKIRSVLKDIREARQAKTRQGLTKIDHSDVTV